MMKKLGGTAVLTDKENVKGEVTLRFNDLDGLKTIYNLLNVSFETVAENAIKGTSGYPQLAGEVADTYIPWDSVDDLLKEVTDGQ